MPMRLKLLGVAAALGVALLGTPPAAGSPIVYTVSQNTFGGPAHADATGSVTTDGVIGVLQPEDILSWDLMVKNYGGGGPPMPPTFVVSFGSDTGGTLSWSLADSLIATPTQLLLNPPATANI